MPTTDLRTHRLGLVSDTHGLVRTELLDRMAGVERILHGGDIGSQEVMRKLEAVAPVTAVSGNVDVAVPGLSYPAFARVELYGLRVLITHYVGMPDAPMPPVAEAIRVEKPRMVLSGHTHKPSVETRDGILYVNPGSCGPKRFRLPCSCGILVLQEREGVVSSAPQVELYDLEAGGKLTWSE